MIGILAASLIVSLGTFWAFSRGAGDFHVFYVAWQHVLHGTPLEIYAITPDRFLYAPGFAWLLAPLAYLPEPWALALWCLTKALLLGFILRLSIGKASIAAFGVVLLARPILIEFQYGQVNLFILVASFWALQNHMKKSDPRADFLSWFFLGIAAVAKLFPIPLLLVPLFVSEWSGVRIDARKLFRERLGAACGMLITLAIPLVSLHWSEILTLMSQWQSALFERGLPLESHNQSFSAFLHHYWSGEPTEIIALHRKQLFLGARIFSSDTIALLSLAWSFICAGLLLAWIFIVPKYAKDLEPSLWVATLVGLQILPSHLVWKPYFIMGLPLSWIILKKAPNWIALGVVFLLINCTGFDVLGQNWGAGVESASILLWTHFLLFWLAFKSRQLLPSRALGSS